MSDGTPWTRPSIATAPAARLGHRLAFDASRAKIVLFGGDNTISCGATCIQTVAATGTWEFTDDKWTQRTLDTEPSARKHHAMAYDAGRAKIVLFGGVSATNAILNDTWEYDGAGWNLRQLATAPPPRFGHALAYDAVRARLVLFGGRSTTGRLEDTWEFDGSAWTQPTVKRKPPARSGHAMTYDLTRSKLIMFGGSGNNSIAYDDTWEFDGSVWAQLTLAAAPSARYDHALTYDAGRARVILFGGMRFGPHADTWEFDGTAWTQLSLALTPAPRGMHALTYDSVRARTMLFGGQDTNDNARNDTWVFTFANPTQPPDTCQDATVDSDGDGFFGCGDATNAADPDCAYRCTPTCSPLTSCNLATEPHCGDGVCDDIAYREDYLICPADCPR